jgi:hypothetical protein
MLCAELPRKYVACRLRAANIEPAEEITLGLKAKKNTARPAFSYDETYRPLPRSPMRRAFRGYVSILSTHCARQALASKGSAKYCVSRATLSPLNSMMLTV